MIESAILFVVVIFIFSILLTGIVLMSHNRANIATKQMNARLELEQIGEYFMGDTRNSDLFETVLENSIYQREDTADNILHLKTASGKTALYIEKDTNGNALAWRYGE